MCTTSPSCLDYKSLLCDSSQGFGCFKAAPDVYKRRFVSHIALHQLPSSIVSNVLQSPQSPSSIASTLMSNAENESPSAGQKRPALQIGPRKKSFVKILAETSAYTNAVPYLIRCGTDPLVHHGRHFGRTVHAMCNVSVLINNTLSRFVEMEEDPDKPFSRE